MVGGDGGVKVAISVRRAAAWSLAASALFAARTSGAQTAPEQPVDLGAVDVGGPPAVTTPWPSPPPFGAKGQWVVLGGSNVSLDSYSYDASGAKGSSFSVAPEVDYFVVRNVSIGVDVDVNHSDSKGYGADGSLVDTQTTTVQGGLRVGVNLPLGPLSLYPQFSIGYEWLRRNETLVTGQSLSVASPYPVPSVAQSGPYVSIYAPLLFHPVSRFFVGFGPEFFHDFGTVDGGPSAPNFGGQRTTVGAGLVAGGEWGGQRDPQRADAPSYEGRRFGEAGEVVLTNSLVASIASGRYAGTGSSYFDVGIGGSVDYFLIPHISLGGAVGASYGRTTGIDGSDGSTTTAQSSGVTFGPRIGADIPLGDWLSAWVVATFEFGFEDYDETSAAGENRDHETVAALDLFAALLVHPAPHFFFGFGPFVYYTYSNSFSFPDQPFAGSVQNHETEVGAGTIVGGWL
jgi:hypothetical protein